MKKSSKKPGRSSAKSGRSSAKSGTSRIAPRTTAPDEIDVRPLPVAPASCEELMAVLRLARRVASSFLGSPREERGGRETHAAMIVALTVAMLDEQSTENDALLRSIVLEVNKHGEEWKRRTLAARGLTYQEIPGVAS